MEWQPIDPVKPLVSGEWECTGLLTPEWYTAAIQGPFGMTTDRQPYIPDYQELEQPKE